jgi:dephospho-CoA kinase
MSEMFKDCLQPTSPVLDEIVTRFGGSAMNPDGRLDTKRLTEVIREDQKERFALEEIVTPFLCRSCLRKICWRWLLGCRVLVVEIPGFFEQGFPLWLASDIVVVNCSFTTQVRRLAEIEGISNAAAEKRLESEMPLAFKSAMATHVLDNDGKIEDLESQVMSLIQEWRRYRVPIYKRPLLWFVLAIIVLGCAVWYSRR